MSTQSSLQPTPEPWLAHEHPERVPDTWCWFCDCSACRLSLTAVARVKPGVVICVKTSTDRICVTASRAAAVWNAHGTLDPLLYVKGDSIREVVVGTGRLSPGRDYYSLSEQEGAHACL